MKLPTPKSPWLGETISAAAPEPVLVTEFGALYQADCNEILPLVKSESIDTVFADPPFNLDKIYGDKVNDALSEEVYVQWCVEWMTQCARVLRPGGAFFLYNLPKWNILLGAELSKLGLDFRHWIAVNIKFGFPISGRLYPSHYSLLYYTKGKPKTFRKIRTPIEVCRHCSGEIKDYGGHRQAMNAQGVNLTDVWTDVPPVRHRKFKSSARAANQLSTKILDRVVELSTEPGDIVLDPFGGSGTTFAVCQSKNRKWLGIEIEDVTAIKERLLSGSVEHHHNDDIVDSYS
ncbi:MAG: site-specific DNA-methyltransferase [Candidatus Obscuribacterales bacterium]|nr:site-specific DNA-methyltransferase [Candidatus Obscuribacterales bacterium]